MTRIKDLPTFETLDPTNWIAVDSNEELEPSGKASPSTLAAFVNSDLSPVLTLTEGAGISISGDPQNPTISSTGSGVGDMLSAIYDPQNISSDAFARENHTGEQPISATTGLQETLDQYGAPPFNTVSDLLSDNNNRIGYEGSSADFIVSAGDIIEAQGFRYEVVAGDATEFDEETAGGVRVKYPPPLPEEVQVPARRNIGLGAADGAYLACSRFSQWANRMLSGGMQAG